MDLADKLMTLAQAAELCACHPRTLRRAINDGHLTAMRLGQSAKSDRIHADDLEAWWQRSRYVPPTVPTFPKVPFESPQIFDADERLKALLGTKKSKTISKRPFVRSKKLKGQGGH
ncbi:helix-turn-helix domain-containing protein [Stenotrophomonas sp. SI-NJAU-1]|jgi:excisionase family DNA binding protein|uniref:helix-turn-helix domain-containing protein n=1 Tax=Stenotrophomonas TaxID=40323 RepID=UPI001122AC31|nr:MULTISPECIES: helix-turn-helix domain-containing protein [Stenotrophomonas]MBO1746892.1 helix-turn-helix domain-containing protein [Stenotrophomonas indicatrix]TPD97875.1 helix-turn-helix domain-containing protein [Stenotrophomonas maltophilia]UEX17825.1 helix-turn-helix domain-containing protein [Stenotrophomonas sp. SI-NJAU-1]